MRAVGGGARIVIRLGERGAYKRCNRATAAPRRRSYEVGAVRIDAGFVYALLRGCQPPVCAGGHIIAAHALAGR